MVEGSSIVRTNPVENTENKNKTKEYKTGRPEQDLHWEEKLVEDQKSSQPPSASLPLLEIPLHKGVENLISMIESDTEIVGDESSDSTSHASKKPSMRLLPSSDPPLALLQHPRKLRSSSKSPPCPASQDTGRAEKTRASKRKAEESSKVHQKGKKNQPDLAQAFSKAGAKSAAKKGHKGQKDKGSAQTSPSSSIAGGRTGSEHSESNLGALPEQTPNDV